ncbi:hypothetical protein ABVT39_013730 [Epinephelus coioides]
MMAKTESQHLNWIRHNQNSIKAEKYKVIVDALNSGREIIPERLTVLPPSIYGSPRWYAKEFQDAMALVRMKGKPHFFLTFTCNPNWPEIKESLFEGEQSSQRPDIYNTKRAEGATGSPITQTIRGLNVSVYNAWVVPYNPNILLRYNAHINLEIVFAVSSVKYLYKHLGKGPDQCLVRLDVTDENMREELRPEEVTRYELGRYIIASEACWRIYDFPIQR